MSGRLFLDTNVLVYAYDSHEPGKQRIAQAVLTAAFRTENYSLSTQVLGELFTVVTRRIPEPLSVDEGLELVELFGALPVVEVDLSLVIRAAQTVKLCQLSYWDALIVAAAERSGCDTILSEDMADGQRYHGVKVVNPFGPGSEWHGDGSE
jgi:predicted nucleic acid-binding protein